MRSVILFSMGLLLCLSTGCATLVRGDSQNVAFKTNPSPAIVIVDGAHYASPVTVKLKRNQTHVVTVQAPGYQAIAFQLQAEWDGASLGNIILPGGSVGFGVDTLNGADKNFRTLATIKLNKSTDPSTQPLQMFQFHGQVLTREEYDKAMKEELEEHRRIPNE